MSSLQGESITAAEIRAHVCPVCNAQKDERCTDATSTGRREVPWHHFARTDLVIDERRIRRPQPAP